MIKQEDSSNKLFFIVYMYILKDKDNPIDVWKNLSSLFDKNVDVSAYSLENKIYEFGPKFFDRIVFCC